MCRRWLEVGWILADLDTSMILIWTDIRAANDTSVFTITEILKTDGSFAALVYIFSRVTRI